MPEPFLKTCFYLLLSFYFAFYHFILPFICHKPATTCEIDLNGVSNSKLKLDLCNCVETKIIGSTAPPQYPHKRGTIFLDTLHGDGKYPGTPNSIEELITFSKIREQSP